MILSKSNQKSIISLKKDIKGDILNLFFDMSEEHLLQPTFVMDHPIEISYKEKKPENPEYVERFEFFMNGWR